jgi:hypothetical protein
MLYTNFQHIDLTDLQFDNKILTALEKRSVSMLVKWTPGGLFKFHKINWKIKGGEWNRSITQTFNSTSGNETFFIGEFSPAISISVKLRIEAFSDVPQAILMMVQTNPAQLLTRNPIAGFKSLLNGDPWVEDLEVDTI